MSQTSSALDEHRFDKWIALLATIGIAIHLVLRWFPGGDELAGSFARRDRPLLAVLIIGGVPLVIELLWRLVRREFGSDVLAGISIVTAIALQEYLAGALVVLMLSGGEAIEAFAVRRASSVLQALAKRMPTQAHRKFDDTIEDISVEQVTVGETLVVFPHEVCPVDGTVLAGSGSMDESFLTGEPYLMPKTPGSTVISGALNGAAALTIRADRRAVDSRYAQIMKVMQGAEQRRPHMRRLGDSLGAVYTPVSVALALLAWWWSGDVTRFLAVLVTATPCPLLIAIPVAIIGAISLSARRGIIIRDPAVLERIETCRVAIFDKTGTLTYGQPTLTEILIGDGSRQEWLTSDEALALIGSVERYSKHPLAAAILAAADEKHIALQDANEVHELPGQGLTGVVGNRRVRITSRSKLQTSMKTDAATQVDWKLPSQIAGMECIAIIDEAIPVTCRFRDQPRTDGAPFVKHLAPRHHFERVMIVSGDRESEVRYLADLVGIEEVYFGQTPEQKLELVRRETARANTVFVGDGINDAPALTSATVGIAFGGGSDITSEAAHAVILDSSLSKVDELLHIGERLRRVALQSAVGGMLLSLAAMLLAACGRLPPVSGAIAQEVIDLFAVLNALRAARSPGHLADFGEKPTSVAAAHSPVEPSVTA